MGGMNQRKAPTKNRPEPLCERHDKVRRVVGAGLKEDQSYGDEDAEQYLQRHLRAPGQTEVSAVNYLEVIVSEADASERESRKDRDPDELIAQIRPEKSGDDDCNDDEHSTHRGRAGFLLVSLGTFFANVLTDLEFSQASNDPRADDHPHEKCREACKSSSKG